MKTNVKIVMAGVNIACLLITLLYPNSATPVSLLPVIVTVTSWVFLSREDGLSNKAAKRQREYLVFSTVLAVICVVMGVTSRIQQAKCGTGYVVCFIKETALIGDFSFDYAWFAGTVFFAILFLIVSEVIAAKRGRFQQPNEKGDKSMNEWVLLAIKSSSVKSKQN